MDLAIAIWRINPAAEYRLNATKDAILEWRGPGPQPTAQELTDAWNAYVAERDTAAAAQATTDAERAAAESDLKTQYQQAITRLDQIASFDSSTTAAQVRQGVVDLAIILKRTLRLLKAQVT